MKTRIFLVAMALVVFASLSFGQGFCRFLYNDAFQLTVNGDGTGGPLPDGTPIYIYWDADGNGISPNDELACTIPPPCLVNYCTFPMNGEAVGLGAGYFIADLDFCSVGCLPTPATFYFAINCLDGTRSWVTPVMTFTSGPADLPLYVWNGVANCGNPPVCNPPQPASVTITAAGGGQPQLLSTCIPLCAQGTTTVSICSGDGHAWNPANPPVSTWHEGCLPPGCDVGCAPSTTPTLVTGPFYNAATGCWDYTVVGQTDNTCFCFTFDHFLAAGIDVNYGLVAAPGDNSVSLSWKTSSIIDFDHFVLARNGETVANVAVDNSSPAGHTYQYTDRAANGTTYTYTLTGPDGSVLLTSEAVTPSFNAAVITEYALHQNFPNPFNPSTEIAFDVLNSNPVTLKVYNAAGQEVATLVNGATYAGGKRYVVNFNASNLTSGLYFFSVKIGSEFSATKKMLLVK